MMKHWLNTCYKWLMQWQPSEEVKSVVMPRLQVALELYNRTHPNWTVRLGNLHDVDTLVELERLGYSGYMAWEAYHFRKDMQTNPYAVYLLLERDGEIIGFISGRMTFKGAHISHIIVHPNYQSQGYGKELLTLWVSLAQQQQIRYATLEVRESNTSARALYAQYGFKEWKHIAHYYTDGEPALRLRKDLLKEEW